MIPNTPTSLEKALPHANREILWVQVTQPSSATSEFDDVLARAQRWVLGVIPSLEEPKK